MSEVTTVVNDVKAEAVKVEAAVVSGSPQD